MPIIKMSLAEAQAKAAPFTPAQQARLAAIEAGDDSLIDFSDQENITSDKIASGRYVVTRRGGARTGAGRKSTGNQPVQLRLPPLLIRRLRAEAKRRGTTLSALAAERLAVTD